jgi:hypothetical protein
MKHCLLCTFISGALLYFSCATLTVSGGSGTDLPDAVVVGCIIDASGNPMPHTTVALLPYDYNPVIDRLLPNSYSSTTDTLGMFWFKVATRGVYNVEAVHSKLRSRALIQKIAVVNDTNAVPTQILQNPGRIIVTLPENTDPFKGYVYIPGTSCAVLLNGNESSVVLDSVPAGTARTIYYSARNSTIKKTIRSDIPVPSGDSVVIANPDWQYARRLFLNTTAGGANVSGNVYNFPVLIRLTDINFDFTQTSPGGADIRFTKQDNAPLSCEIERWDVSLRSAEIWVKIDTIFGNDSMHSVTMYWGNPNAASASNSMAVFDTGNGFQGVWHLNEPVSGLVKDATINGYDGTAVNAPAQASVTAMVGSGREFAAGDSGYITIPGTAAGKLNFPENGMYALSAWAFIDTLDGRSHAIADKGDQQYNLEVFQDKWEFAEYKTTQKWDMSSTPALTKQWTFVTGVRNQTKQYLFVNGQCVDSMIENQFKPGVDRNTGYNVMFGKTAGDSALDFPYYFHGGLDEIRMCNRALSADWIKLCYMNQKTKDQLILFRR